MEIKREQGPVSASDEGEPAFTRAETEIVEIA